MALQEVVFKRLLAVNIRAIDSKLKCKLSANSSKSNQSKQLDSKYLSLQDIGNSSFARCYVIRKFK